MSQDTKLVEIPTRYTPITDSAKNILSDMVDFVEENKITGIYAVILCPNGKYTIFHSEGIHKHQQVGILAEIQHDLLNK